VVVDGPLRDVEPLADLAVRQAAGEEVVHLLLTRGEAVRV
jgi:hypothetical protein